MGRPLLQPVLGLSNYPAGVGAGDWLEEAAWDAPHAAILERWRRRLIYADIDKGVGSRTVAVGATVKLW